MAFEPAAPTRGSSAVADALGADRAAAPDVLSAHQSRPPLTLCDGAVS